MTETKALIVEHEEKSKLILDEVLLAIGHRYEIATSLAEARKLLIINDYAYVLLNCMIPTRPGGMPRRQNAENFLDNLRKIKGDTMPPVIVMFDPMPEAGCWDEIAALLRRESDWPCESPFESDA